MLYSRLFRMFKLKRSLLPKDSSVTKETSYPLPKIFFQIVSNLPLELQQDIFYYVLLNYEVNRASSDRFTQPRELIDVNLFITNYSNLKIELFQTCSFHHCDCFGVNIKFVSRKGSITHLMDREDLHMLQEHVNKFGLTELVIREVGSGMKPDALLNFACELIKENPIQLTVLWSNWILEWNNSIFDMFSKITSIKLVKYETISSKWVWFQNLKELAFWLNVKAPFTENDDRLITIHNMALAINSIVIELGTGVPDLFNTHFRKLLIQHGGRIKFQSSYYNCIIDESFIDFWRFNNNQLSLNFPDGFSSFDLSILPKMTKLEKINLNVNDIANCSFKSKSIKDMTINCGGLSGCDFSDMESLERFELRVKGIVSYCSFKSKSIKDVSIFCRGLSSCDFKNMELLERFHVRVKGLVINCSYGTKSIKDWSLLSI